MKTFKTIICIILSVIVFGSLMPIALGDSDGSVYAGKEEQDYIYACSQSELSNVRSLLERHGIRLLKESITPVYTLDMLAFAANNTFEIKPSNYSTESGRWQVYKAKTVSENNGFAGNIGFFIKDGVAQLLYFTPSNIIEEIKNEVFPASCSYADHASRIAQLLGSNEIIPPENVRYVNVKGYKNELGDCFYVRVDGNGYFIPIGYISTVYAPAAATNAITISELKAKALEDEQNYIEHTIEMEEWRNEHPGESWIPVRSESESIVTIISGNSVENIIEVNKFFSNLFSSENTVVEPTQTPPGNTPLPEERTEQKAPAVTEKTNRFLYWVVPLTVILLAAGIYAAAVSINKRQKMQ